MTIEYVEKLYNRYSTFYDLLFGKVFHNGREIASELLDLFPGAQLLEVGIGTGLSLPLLPRNIQVTAIDLSLKMLNHARKRIGALNSHHVQLFKMDATQLEFADNSFDRVLATYFISTVPDPIKVILEMKRVCRSGGYLVFLNHFHYEVPVIGSLEKHLSPLFYRIGFRTDLNLQELMEQTGLRIETLEKIDFLGHWKAVRCVSPD
ncbi:class I SAM-dependent methyltransferase [Acidobacteria bacterium AH-259-G07]|nr:class I SAM-dependent methyltransferase [Acidobacteria bacterium AH-259-G07]